MHRRQFIATAAAVGLTGCIGGRRDTFAHTASPAPIRSTTPLQLGANDQLPSNPDIRFTITFNHQTQATIDLFPEENFRYRPRPGHKFLVVAIELTVTNDSWDASPDIIDVSIDNSRYQHTEFPRGDALYRTEGDVIPLQNASLNYPQPISGVKLNSGGELSGWIAYSVPEDATTGMLEIDESVLSKTVWCDFRHDSRIDVAFPSR